MEFELIKAFKGGVSFWKIFLLYQGVAVALYMALFLLALTTGSLATASAWTNAAGVVSTLICIPMLLLMLALPYLLWVNAPSLASGGQILSARIYAVIAGSWLVLAAYPIAAGMLFDDGLDRGGSSGLEQQEADRQREESPKP